MTKNQQKIIDSLIAEFNKRNERNNDKSFNLINLDELDSINKRHKDLESDALASKVLWQSNVDELVDNLVKKIKDEIGHRLCVKRGDEAMNNSNYYDHVFIYKYDTREHNIREMALRFSVKPTYITQKDDITKQYYTIYTGTELRRYVTPNSEHKYKDEVEFFNCEWTKNALKNLLA